MKQDFSVVLLGAGGVGKTSMVSQFIQGTFPLNYSPTIEDCYRHVVQLADGFYHTVKMIDTAGTHQFPAMRELCIRKSQAFVLVFSIDSDESFEEALKIGEQINAIKGDESVAIVMVGNKSDLSNYRQISSDEAEEVVQERIGCSYIETSAKYNNNIADVFLELLSKVLEIQSTNNFVPKKNRRNSLNNLLRLRRNSRKSNQRDIELINELSDSKCSIL